MFENVSDRTVHTEYFHRTVEIKDHKIMVNGQNFLDQPVRNNLRTYDSIQKIATDQRDDYTSRYLLEYSYFKDIYKMIAIDLC